MAEAEYEQLETLLQSDSQSSDLQNADEGPGNVSAHLPEWLIGVIVIVIVLIFVFFAVVVYSLMKERKRARACNYEGTTSAASAADNVEAGKTNGTFRITVSSLEALPTDLESAANVQAGHGTNGELWTLDGEIASTLQRRQHGPSGCQNPAFVDDEDVVNDVSKGGNGDVKQNGEVTNDEETGENKEDATMALKQNGKVVKEENKQNHEDHKNVITDITESGKACTDKANDGEDMDDNSGETNTKLNRKSSSSSKSQDSSLKSSSQSDSSEKQENSDIVEGDSASHISGGTNDGTVLQLVPHPNQDDGQEEVGSEESNTTISSTAEQETVVDEMEEQGRSPEEDGEDELKGSECSPGECSSSGVCLQEVQVMMMRSPSPSPSDPPTCLMMVHRNQQTATDQGKKAGESSTDDTDEDPGASTSL